MTNADSYIKERFSLLRSYCEKEHYKGWDPYDGLNSKVFKAIPLLPKWAFARLCVIQGFKRSPINLRPLLMVEKDYNAKGIGLFLQGYCNLYRLGWCEKEDVTYLADLLVSLRSKGYHGSCWGYNFDWQRLNSFLFPKYTPTVVATSFCATALMDAYELTQKREYLDVALSSADFVLKDLHRTKVDGGEMFSYSPLQGHDTIFNASLLGSRLLSFCYKYSGIESYKDAAKMSVSACCNYQRKDGAWTYGIKDTDKWIDSFHTGYNLDGLIAYEECTGDITYHDNMERGFDFYINNFFKDDGSPKYYNDSQYPIDIHCPAQLLVTLFRLHKDEKHRELAEKVLLWTLRHMQDEKGFFYYQLKKGISSKISYMRWSNAFMFYAMSFFFMTNINNNHLETNK